MHTQDNIYRLAEFSSEIRKLTLKRLEEVPEGFINWRLNTNAMSFAHMVQHIIDVDELFFGLVTSKQKDFKWRLGSEEPHVEVKKTVYELNIKQLKAYQQKRYKVICAFDELKMNIELTDKNQRKISFWWFIMQQVLEHEIYHRGQIAAYLKVLKGEVVSN